MASNDFTPAETKALLIEIVKDKDKEGLWLFIKEYFKLEIPRTKICPDHDAPFDFVADYIFGVSDFMIVLANRSGGKTMDFGVLDTMMSWLNDNTEVATIGAIQSQALKCYDYFKKFSSLFPFKFNISSRTMKMSKLENGSVMQVLTGTMSGVNSPHPQLAFFDEIDLMAWPILQQGFSMAQSNRFTKAKTVVTSTRKFANGPMQRMLEEAKEKNAKVYKWCIWEVMEKWPTDKELLKRIKKEFGSSLPPKINQADGYYTWEDVLTKHSILDLEAWETEWICKRPGLEGVIYGSSYSDENNLISADWVPNGDGYLYLAEDYGYGEGHPDVILFCWIPLSFDRLIVFDELYITKTGTDEIWEKIKEKLNNYGFIMPDAESGIEGDIKGWSGDPHGLTETEDRQAKGAPIMEKNDNSELYIINNGIPLVKKLLQSGRLMISARCENLRLEFLSYKKKKNIDGTYSKDPQKKDDHGPDALRYLVILVHDIIFARVFDQVSEEKQPKTPELEVSRDNLLSIGNEEKPITAGMLDMKF